jgi:hypothetical protein
MCRLGDELLMIVVADLHDGVIGERITKAVDRTEPLGAARIVTDDTSDLGDELSQAIVGHEGLRLPLFVTPQHPEYVSGHSTNSSAMATALAMLFGDDPGVAIVATSPTNPGFERHWATLSEGVEEVIDARVYSGIHYRTSDEEGTRLGRRIAQFVVNRALRAAKHWDR